jgi:S-adenosyl methyltransferase
VTDQSPAPSSTTDRSGEVGQIDTSVAHPARVYDYLLGGTDNFAVDREAAQLHAATNPGGIDAVRTDIRANRGFLVRAVRHLAGEAGIRQFLDIGTGVPNADNVHAVAQQTAPDSRIVYVDNDPIVLAHAHSLLRSTSEGAAAYIDGDLCHPDDIIEQARATLDFSQPIAVMLVAILHFELKDCDPYEVVARLMGAVPSGSYLVISHLTQDIQPEVMAKLAEVVESNPSMDYRFVMRTRAELARFFDGLELVEPGVAPMAEWLPPDTAPDLREWSAMYYCGVGRKP